MKKEPLNEKLHDIYSFFLACQEFEMDDETLKAVCDRGFTPEHIKKIGLRKLVRSQDAVTKTALEFRGELNRVPGFFQTPKSNRLSRKFAWQMMECSGLAIPVRDADGKIAAIKVRSLKKDGPKYFYLSSKPGANRTGGCRAQLSVHHPLKKEDTTKKIRITEGELKAEIAYLRTGVYTISIPGISSWRLAVEAAKSLGAEEALIAYDADKDAKYIGYGKDGDIEETKQIGKSLAKLYRALKSEGIKPVIETWPEEWGKGIDDILRAGYEPQIMTQQEAEKWVEDILKIADGFGWVYLKKGCVFFNPETGEELEENEFNNAFHAESIRIAAETQSKIKPASKRYLESPWCKMHYDKMFYPGKAQEFEWNGLSYINTYRDKSVKPKRGDVSIFLDHINYLFPDEQEAALILNWMAHNIQYPGQKILWALVIHGQEQGTGKSYLKHVLSLLLGQQYVSSVQNETVQDRFTDWLVDTQIVVVEEIMAYGRQQFMNTLKPFITEPFITHRGFHRKGRKVINIANFLMFTNHNNALLLDDEDRRYGVFSTEAKPKEPAYYAKLFNWTEQNTGQIMHWMLSQDLNDFRSNHLTRAPKTENKKRMIEASRQPWEELMIEAMEEKEYPFNEGVFVLPKISDWLYEKRRKEIHSQAIARTLKSAGAQIIKRTNKRRVYATPDDADHLINHPSEVDDRLERHLAQQP